MAGGGRGVGGWGLSSWFAYLPSTAGVCVMVSLNDVHRRPNEGRTPRTCRRRYLSADERLTHLARLFVDGRRVVRSDRKEMFGPEPADRTCESVAGRFDVKK